MKLFSLLLLLTCGCASDPAFILYKIKFERVIEVKVKRVQMYFGDAKGYAAYCEHRFFSRVVVDKGHWDNLSLLDRELLVFHELGHCVLDADHREGTRSNGCPDSIMTAGDLRHEFKDHCYPQDFEYYWDELRG